MSSDRTNMSSSRIPSRRTCLSAHPRLHVQWTDDGSRTLIDPSTGVAYHSGCGAVAETRAVYLENSGVGRALDAREFVSVLEIGFGTGLGFLLTADRAIHANAGLRYEAIERELLCADVIESMAFDKQLQHRTLFNDLCEWCDEFGLTNENRFTVSHSDPRRNSQQSLRIHRGDAGFVMNHWNRNPPLDHGPPFDAVYFDPFDPVNNPDAWSESMMRLARQMLRPGGRLVSYCVSRAIRDRFASVGFDVYRVPGPPGGKREVLVAIPTVDAQPGDANRKLDLQALLERAM